MNIKLMNELEKLSGKKLTLGNLIWSIRMGEEMNQVQFAEKLQISKQYLCDIERGRKFLSQKKAKEFADKLGYSAEQFLKLSLQDTLEQNGFHFTVELIAA